MQDTLKIYVIYKQKKKEKKNFFHVKEVSRVKYHAASWLFTENGRVEFGTHNKPIT